MFLFMFLDLLRFRHPLPSSVAVLGDLLTPLNELRRHMTHVPRTAQAEANGDERRCCLDRAGRDNMNNPPLLGL